MKQTYKIYSLGCKVNQYDSRKLEEELNQVGFSYVKKDAGLVIINTCCVTKSAITKDKQMLTRAKKENPKAKIVFMGCFSKVYQDDIDIKKLGIDILWKVGDTGKLVEKIMLEFDIKKLEFYNNYFRRVDLESRSRYFLKVQDGCEQFCAYCIIPYTRGKLRSRDLKDVVAEATKAIEDGYGEIVLSGIHLGLYGINNNPQAGWREENINLVGLLKELVKIKNLKKIRLSSIEINDVSDELIEFMKKNDKMCAHLHISLQSGCDKILKKMARPYTTKYFRDRVNKIRKAIPDIAISTDIIIGFPTEDENDFETTKKFIEEMRFSRLHIFSFSAHEKTPAWSMPNKVARLEIKKRSKTLRELSKKLEEEYRNKFKNKELMVVVEAIIDNKIKGKSQYYFDIWFSEKDIASGAVKIDKTLIGKLVKINN